MRTETLHFEKAKFVRDPWRFGAHLLIALFCQSPSEKRLVSDDLVILCATEGKKRFANEIRRPTPGEGAKVCAPLVDMDGFNLGAHSSIYLE